MTAPTFTRGTTPYWTYPCGCEASALALRHCPTHAAAPEMLAYIKQRVNNYETSLSKCSPYTREHTIARGEPDSVREARALLARITRTTRTAPIDDCPTCGSTLAEREDARLRAED